MANRLFLLELTEAANAVAALVRTDESLWSNFDDPDAHQGFGIEQLVATIRYSDKMLQQGL